MICMIMIPLVIQTIEDDDDRAFIEAIYIKYVKLMYITARTYCGALVQWCIYAIYIHCLSVFSGGNERSKI